VMGGRIDDVAVDERNPSVMYVGAASGGLWKTTNAGTTWELIYLAGNRVFTSTDRGDTWTASRDLTRAENRDALPIMGVLPTADVLSRNDGVSAWGTITTLAESSVTAGLLWAGTDEGHVAVSKDDGKTWTHVQDRIPALANRGRISRVEPSHHDATVTYVAIDRHEWDDFAPYVFVTRDAGQTWTSVTGNLPAVGWVNVVREHPENPRLLFAGTETGLFVSLNGGERWTRFTGAFPTVPVDDLVIHPRDNDLIVGTHGRSLYVLDDISWLSGVTSPSVLTAAVHLFPPRPAVVKQLWKHESYMAQRQFVGANPPHGAVITYHLASPSEATLVVRGPEREVVRELTATGEAGFNRVVWDLRAAPPDGVTGARGPHVLPGKYTVYLAAAGGSIPAGIQVDWDPLFPVPDEERRLRFTFLKEAGELQRRLLRPTTALAELRNELTKRNDVKGLPAVAAFLSQVEQRQRRLGGAGGGGEEEGGFGGGLRAQVNGLVGELDGNGAQQGTLSGPTAVQRARLAAASAEVDKLVTDVDKVLSDDLERLNAELDRLKIPRVAAARASSNQ
jgi:hypothetical protein